MKYRVVTLVAAEIDLADLADDLYAKSPNAAAHLRQELRDLLSQLETFPFAYQATIDREIRRAVLRSCRHMLYFRVKDGHVEIIAILPQMLGAAALRERGLDN